MINEESVAAMYVPPKVNIIGRQLAWWKKFTYRPERDSNLVKHAEFELRRAGLFDADADYGGMVAEAVMNLVRVHAKEGHSGNSHAVALSIFNIVVNYKTLTPITGDPAEWFEVDRDGPARCWQNRRMSSCFSNTAGKSYYDIDEKGRPIHKTGARK